MPRTDSADALKIGKTLSEHSARHLLQCRIFYLDIAKTCEPKKAIQLIYEGQLCREALEVSDFSYLLKEGGSL
jgi:hypothetical protein